MFARFGLSVSDESPCEQRAAAKAAKHEDPLRMIALMVMVSAPPERHYHLGHIF